MYELSLDQRSGENFVLSAMSSRNLLQDVSDYIDRHIREIKVRLFSYLRC